MATGDLYIAMVNATLDGQNLTNVYSYESTAIVSNASDLNNRIINQYMPEWTALVSDSVLFVDVKSVNLFDDDDVVTTAIGLNGLLVGDFLPVHNAFTIRITHDRPSIKPGSKRFTGLTENNQSDGEWLVGMLTAWLTFQDIRLEQPLVGALGVDAYTPIVIKRIREVDIEGKVSYRFPTNLAEAVWGVVVDTVQDVNVSTQISRKLQRA